MPDTPLNFEHAEPGPAQPATLTCVACGQQVADQYYEIGGRIVCESCRRQVESDLARRGGPGGFARAAALGLGAAIGGAVLWYAVQELLDMHIGLIAIAVGYLVGRAVHYGSRGRGGWPYQMLAVALTYLAIVSTYIPAIASGIPADDGSNGVLRLFAIVVSTSIAPFLVVYYGGGQNIISLLIIFFGLSQAWRMNRRVELRVSGPFRVGASPPAGAPPSA